MVPLIISVILAFFLIMTFSLIAGRYKRCPSNKILVIYGKTGSGASRCVHGGAAFVIPLLQSYAYLDLEPFVVPIDLNNALSTENIRVAVPTTVTAAISNEPGIMENAAVRLLGLKQQQIQAQAQDIILGQMRAVIATMKIEEINRDRQAFMAKVNEAVSCELEKIGLALINVNIRDIEDESGYIKALGRKAAAEAINQANIDVAEQERTGQIGVAERQRDTRVAVAKANAQAEAGEAEAQRDRRKQVAAANAQAEIGETEAVRDRRKQVATYEAEAVERETLTEADKAGYRANQRVAEEKARQSAESAAREADGAIRVAQEIAQKRAEEARSERERARLNAEVVVPTETEKQKITINAEAEKQRSILVAQGEAEARYAKMEALARGQQAILEAKATGYERLVAACGGDKGAASMLIIEKLEGIAGIQAKAIQDLPIEKIIVWDGGGQSGMSGLGGRLMGALPPMHELAKQVGLELPEFLGRMQEAAKEKTEEPTQEA